VVDKLNDEVGTECSSTEEMIRTVQDTNEQIHHQEEASRRLENSVRRGNLVVISQDVKALYPSLDWDVVIEIVGKLIEETDVKFENMDYRVLGKYLAIHLTPEEITKNNLKTVTQRE
jgi:hypothetical protein